MFWHERQRDSYQWSGKGRGRGGSHPSFRRPFLGCCNADCVSKAHWRALVEIYRFVLIVVAHITSSIFQISQILKCPETILEHICKFSECILRKDRNYIFQFFGWRNYFSEYSITEKLYIHSALVTLGIYWVYHFQTLKLFKAKCSWRYFFYTKMNKKQS